MSSSHYRDLEGGLLSRASTASSLEDQPGSTHRGKQGLVAATICSLGYNVGFGLKYALLTSFLSQLGMPATWVSVAWLCSPVTGSLQPLIGRMSDRYQGFLSPWGRRRPFILLGCCLAILGHLMIAFCVDAGSMLGDDASERARPYATLIFLMAFFVLELGNNMMAVIHRAFIPEVTQSTQQQFEAFSWTCAWSGLGNIAAYAMTSIPWDAIEGFHEIPFLNTESCGSELNCANTKTTFLLAAVITTISAGITCRFTAERPRGRERSSYAKDMSPIVALQDPIICATYIITAAAWGGWISLQVYGSHFCATEVFGGSADPRQRLDNLRFLEGSRVASAGLTINTVFMTAAALCLGRIKSHFGLRATWSGSMLFAGLLLCLSVPISRSQATLGVQAWLALFGPAFAVQCALPFDIVAKRAPSHLKGALLGYLNWAVCLPQLILSLVGGPLTAHFGSDVAAFLLGAGCLLLASMLVCTILPATVETASSLNQSCSPGTPITSKTQSLWPSARPLQQQLYRKLAEPLLRSRAS